MREGVERPDVRERAFRAPPRELLIRCRFVSLGIQEARRALAKGPNDLDHAAKLDWEPRARQLDNLRLSNALDPASESYLQASFLPELGAELRGAGMTVQRCENVDEGGVLLGSEEGEADE